MACCVSFVLRGSRVVGSLLEFGQFGVVLVRFFFASESPERRLGREVAFESAESAERS